MIKNDQVTFKELPPPMLGKILSIKQPEKDLIYQHWRHLMTVIEIQNDTLNSPPARNTYMLYKCKYQLGFVNFLDNCLLYQRKFKIIHGQSHEITALKFHLINIRFQNVKKKELLVAIGFFDGSCEIHNLSVTQKSVILKKLLFLQNNDKHEPVTSIVFCRKNLYLCRLHHVAVYRDLLTAAANIIIQDEVGKPKGKQTIYKFSVDNLPIEGLALGATLSITTGTNSIYIFNETEGAKALDYQTQAVNGSIIDSLVNVKETLGENLVLGDTNNYLKIIYYSKNYVERFTGFKNYCSSIDHVLFPTHEELWVGDYHGSVTYFQRCTNADSLAPNKQIRMVEFNVKYSVKVCQNGIKQLRAIGKLLFILDTQSNIFIFDIIRKDALEHMKTVELQSVQEYSSNQT